MITDPERIREIATEEGWELHPRYFEWNNYGEPMRFHARRIDPRLRNPAWDWEYYYPRDRLREKTGEEVGAFREALRTLFEEHGFALIAADGDVCLVELGYARNGIPLTAEQAMRRIL